MAHTNIDILTRRRKPIRWMGAARTAVRTLPAETRGRIGFELFAVQDGRQPSDFKPMPSVGSGVYELRVHGDKEHRVFYIARFEEAIYVLHVFEKRSRKTADSDLRIGQRRYADVIRLRQDEGRR
jgi:phage-related protein